MNAPAIGTPVRALYPNAWWGEGTVTAYLPARFKPLVVTKDDGTVGHFHLDQVEVIR